MDLAQNRAVLLGFERVGRECGRHQRALLPRVLLGADKADVGNHLLRNRRVAAEINANAHGADQTRDRSRVVGHFLGDRQGLLTGPLANGGELFQPALNLGGGLDE